MAAVVPAISFSCLSWSMKGLDTTLKSLTRRPVSGQSPLSGSGDVLLEVSSNDVSLQVSLEEGERSTALLRSRTIVPLAFPKLRLNFDCLLIKASPSSKFSLDENTLLAH
jgi:hypothetical protein